MTIAQAKRAYAKFKTQDPYPKVAPALLNKWDIQNYVEKVGMITPFHVDDLKGITYDVRLRGTCLYWREQNGVPIEKSVIVDNEVANGENTVTLEPNSITFVTLEPYFQIPDYIALRYNFKIRQIYKGLLLGTGPIVDPGFHGYLSIPIHNLTKNQYILRVDEPLISIEFTKINPYSCGSYPKFLPTNYQKVKDFSAPERTVKDYINDALKFMPDPILPSIQNKNIGICNSVPSLEISIETAKSELLKAVEKKLEPMTVKVEQSEQRSRKDFWLSIMAIIITVVLSLGATILGFFGQTSWLDDSIDNYEQILKDQQAQSVSQIDELTQQLELTNSIILLQCQLLEEKEKTPIDPVQIEILESRLANLIQELSVTQNETLSG